MLSIVLSRLRRGWRPLFAADLLLKGAAWAVLTPLVSLLVRGYLQTTGRGAMTDLELARFLLHPWGWVGMLIVATLSIGITVLELAVLMLIAVRLATGRPPAIIDSLRLAARGATGLLNLTGRVVARLLAIGLPFLAVAGLLYRALLTEHDINFYLSDRPPEFWTASILIGTVLTALICAAIAQLAAWSLAIPLHLLERTGPAACLRLSRERTRGRRRSITGWLGGWLILNSLLSTAATAVVIAAGHWLVKPAADSIWRLVLTLGGVLAAGLAVNVALSVLAATSLAVLLSEIYLRLGGGPASELLEAGRASAPQSLQWSPRRTAIVGVLVLAATVLAGLWSVSSLPLADRVEVVAHRGGGGAAPENSLSAIRQAIADGADWIEVDVQETRDGVVVVAHDADLLRVAGFPGKIWETTMSELREVDIGRRTSDRYREERVPTLEDVLQACRGRARVVIELKYYGHDQDLERKVVELVESAEMADDVVIMSMHRPGLEKVRRLRPGWRTGLVTAVAAGDLTRVEADFLAVSTRLASRPLIQLAHVRGREIYVWTVNDVQRMNLFLSRGVDKLITDYPAVARQVLAERAALSAGERLLLELQVLFDAAWD